MNKFKLWFSRNDFKIVTFIILIFAISVFSKRFNSYYKNQMQSEKNTINKKQEVVEEELLSVNENYFMIKQIENEEDFIPIDKSSEEFKKVTEVIQKIINYVYKANLDKEDMFLKRDIYYMFSEDLRANLISNEKRVKIGNVLDFIFCVDNTENYVIENVYKCYQNGNVVRYGVLLKYQEGEGEALYNYVVINMDYNNNTFSYDGTSIRLDRIKNFGSLDFIESKGSNDF